MATLPEREPARVAGGATALAALLAVGIAFGLPLTDDQEKSVLLFFALGGPVAVWKYVRPRVTPVHR